MQTQFTAEQLAQPDIAAADEILRKCVHCGFCTATCPTFVLTGDERDSPRPHLVDVICLKMMMFLVMLRPSP